MFTSYFAILNLKLFLIENTLLKKDNIIFNYLDDIDGFSDCIQLKVFEIENRFFIFDFFDPIFEPLLILFERGPKFESPPQYILVQRKTPKNVGMLATQHAQPLFHLKIFFSD